MTRTTPAQRAELRRMHEEATPDWRQVGRRLFFGESGHLFHEDGFRKVVNCRIAAAARNALPDLLDDVDELETQLADALSALKKQDDNHRKEIRLLTDAIAALVKSESKS